MNIIRANICKAAMGLLLFSVGTPWSAAVEPAGEALQSFMGSMAYSVPIEVPAWHNLEPRLAIGYSSVAVNGFLGVGWQIEGFPVIERGSAAGGVPRFDDGDVYRLEGEKLMPCGLASQSPGCRHGGTHALAAETFERVVHDPVAGTWTVWSRSGVRSVYAPLVASAQGTYRWGLAQRLDTRGNTVSYTWECPGACYPSSVSYGPYTVTFAREERPDAVAFGRGPDLRRMTHRLAGVIVRLGSGEAIRGYELSYDLSLVGGRSLLVSIRQYGRDLVQDADGRIVGGDARLAPYTFTYTRDDQGRHFVPAAPSAPTPPGAVEAVAWAERHNAVPVGDGSSLEKVGGTPNAWDARASSTRALVTGDGYVEVTAGIQPGKRFGLGRAPKDFEPDQIDFSLLETNGPGQHYVYAYERAVAYGPWPVSPGDTLRVEISAGSVWFKVNGTAVHVLHGRRIVYPLVAAASLSFPGARLLDARLAGALQDAASWCWGEQLLTGDFDGDGRGDQACYTGFNQTLRVALSRVAGFAPAAVWHTGVNFTRALTGDFDADGRTDLAVYAPGNGEFRVARSTGDALAAPVLWGRAAGITPAGVPTTCSTPFAVLGTGDFDGDGRLDVSCRRADTTHPVAPSPLFVGLSDGASFSFGVWNDLGCDAPAYQRTGALDFDGDGRDDWYCQSQSGRLDVYLSSGSTFDWPLFAALGSSFCGSRYVFGDLNADGRTDAACLDNGKVALSNGRAFVEQGSFGPSCPLVPGEEPGSTQAFVADLDGDGAGEIVCNNAAAPANDIEVRAWSATGLTPPATALSAWCDGRLRSGDFDGDGKTDLLCDNLGTPVASAGSSGVRADLLETVTTPLGGRYRAEYALSSACVNANNPPVKPILRRLTSDDGRGSVGTTTYTLAGGLFDRAERRFLGFRHVREEQPCEPTVGLCPYKETWLRQDSLAGSKVERVDERAGSGALLRSVTFEYARSNAVPPYALLPIAETWTSPGGELGGARRRRTTYTYDDYGNLATLSEHGDTEVSGDERTLVWEYAYNTQAYIVELPAAESLLGGATAAGALLRRQRFGYDGGEPGLAPIVGDQTLREAWVDGDGSVLRRTRTYDAFGNLVATTDESGATTAIEPDPLYRLFPATRTDALGHVTRFEWDAGCAVPLRVTDANDQEVTFEYDAFCRRTRRESPLGGFELTHYVGFGDPATQHIRSEGPSPSPGDGSGHSFVERYLDGLGRVWRTTRKGPSPASTIVSDVAYDRRGLISELTAPRYANEPAQPPERYEYDGLARLTRRRLPDGNHVRYAYSGWTTTTYDALDHARTVWLDAYNQPVRVEESDDDGRLLVTRSEYDARGALVALHDPAGNAWSWTYDSLGRLVSRHDPDSGKWTFEYDTALRLARQTDAKGQSVTLRHDAAGRVIEKRSQAPGQQPSVATFGYDETRPGFHNLGRLGSMVDARGFERYDYDAAGRQVRLTRRLDGLDYVLERRYNAAGLLAGLTWPDGDVIGAVEAPLAYDAAGRLRSAPGLVTLAQYDAQDRPTLRVYGNGVTSEWAYHARGWLRELSTQADGRVLQHLRFTNDAAGRVTRVDGAFPHETWDYSYDVLGRLRSARDASDSGAPQTWDYDAAGNLVYNSRVGTLAYPAPGGVRPHAPSTVGASSMSYDANGNLVSGRGRSLVWDAENRVVQAGDVTFAYDGVGSRLERNSPAGASLFPLGDDYEVRAGVVTKHIELPGMGLVAKRVAGQTYWLHLDRQGSIQVVTDAGGVVVQRRAYRPYGEVIVESASDPDPRGFLARPRDPDMGLIDLQTRWFDPQAGLYLSPEPLHPATVGVLGYTYARRDPVNFSDPSGLDPVPGPVFPGGGSCTGGGVVCPPAGGGGGVPGNGVPGSGGGTPWGGPGCGGKNCGASGGGGGHIPRPPRPGPSPVPGPDPVPGPVAPDVVSPGTPEILEIVPVVVLGQPDDWAWTVADANAFAEAAAAYWTAQGISMQAAPARVVTMDSTTVPGSGMSNFVDDALRQAQLAGVGGALIPFVFVRSVAGRSTDGAANTQTPSAAGSVLIARGASASVGPHELGHLFGLPHAWVPLRLMFPYWPLSGTWLTDAERLSARRGAGVRAGWRR